MAWLMRRIYGRRCSSKIWGGHWYDLRFQCRKEARHRGPHRYGKRTW